MNVLITGARAPISADLAKAFATQGHSVYLADSLNWPVSRVSPWPKKTLKLPAPATHFEQFSAAILAAVSQHQIEAIVPTSEEVFWLAQVPELKGILRAPCIEQLRQLHHKGLFAKVVASLGYGAQHAIELATKEQAQAFTAQYHSKDFVFKPCYSRFGMKVRISPTELDVLALNYATPWLAQTKVEGTEVCLYCVANEGDLCLMAAYKPLYRVKDGASVYFEPIQHPALAVFAQAVCKELGLSGQVSFDVMLTEKGLVALECNPRGTSGIHLAAQQPKELVNALLYGAVAPASGKWEPRMLGLALICYQASKFATKKGLYDYRRAKDALACADVPWYGPLLTTAELALAAMKHKKSLIDTSTHDFEWNG